MNTEILNSLPRKELIRLAKTIEIPVGKSKSATVANLTKAIEDGTLYLKTTVTFFGPKTPLNRNILLMSKIRWCHGKLVTE